MKKDSGEAVVLQRAGLMGLVLAILNEEQDLSIVQVKHKIVNVISFFIETDTMCMDLIDKEVLTACKLVIDQETTLEQLKDLLN